MDFTSKINTTLPETGDAFIQSPVTLGLTAVVVAFFSLLAFVSYAPKVHKQSPAFTTDTLPILGSTGFTTRQWARCPQDVLRPPRPRLVSGAIILPFGVHFWLPIHEIFRPGFHNGGRSNTFFLRRLLDLTLSMPLRDSNVIESTSKGKSIHAMQCSAGP
ncbi:hypothetical protein B0T19DRAFT_441059 [Cercophora scortea]|uniref:Uncharacterized protein n=1 Tax=Cercophora scortea TaxID=314031 RepID=A0AAE0MCT4_9PEZI|nr:hypothetical protein B0T19DRAFT_441059 [Cercophora scortea]